MKLVPGNGKTNYYIGLIVNYWSTVMMLNSPQSNSKNQVQDKLLCGVNHQTTLVKERKTNYQIIRAYQSSPPTPTPFAPDILAATWDFDVKVLT